MHLHLPIEQLVQRVGTAFQFGFATEAKELLPEGEEFLLNASHRGLHVLARNEEALALPRDVLLDVYGPSLRIDAPRVRLIEGVQVQEPIVHVRISLPTQYRESVKRAMRRRVRGVRASDPLRAALRGAARRPAWPAGRAAAAYRGQGKAVGRVEPLRHRDARPGWKSRLTMFFDRRRPCRDITGGVIESPIRGSSTKDLWAAFLSGITLIVVSALAGLYRRSLEWMDVLTAIVGFALLGMAAYDAGREAGRNEIRCS